MPDIDFGETLRYLLHLLGAGAILKHNGGVVGMATAASIWNTGAIGMAVAYGRHEIAIALSAFNVVTLRLGKNLKQYVDEDPKAETNDWAS